MYCKKCEKQLPDDSLFCPFCGERVNQEPKVACCPVCKKTIPDDSEFCPFCGQQQGSHDKASSNTVKSQSSLEDAPDIKLDNAFWVKFEKEFESINKDYSERISNTTDECGLTTGKGGQVVVAVSEMSGLITLMFEQIEFIAFIVRNAFEKRIKGLDEADRKKLNKITHTISDKDLKSMSVNYANFKNRDSDYNQGLKNTVFDLNNPIASCSLACAYFMAYGKINQKFGTVKDAEGLKKTSDKYDLLAEVLSQVALEIQERLYSFFESYSADNNKTVTDEVKNGKKLAKQAPTFVIGKKRLSQKNSVFEKMKSIITNIRNKELGVKELVFLTVAFAVLIILIIGIMLLATSIKNKSDIKKSAEKYTSAPQTFTFTTTTRAYTSYKYTSKESGIEINQQTEKKTSSNEYEDFAKWLEEREKTSTTTTTSTTHTTTTHTTTTRPTTTKPAPFNKLKYSGNGTDTINGINLPNGQYYIFFSSYGSYFSAFYYNGKVSYSQESVSISSGGVQTVKVDGNVKNGYININAEGSWEVEIEQCNSQINPNYHGESFNGNGTDTIYQIDLPKGDYYIIFECLDGYMSAFYYNGIVSYSQDSVSLSGPGKETIKITGPIENGYINISASGNWNIRIEPA